MVSDNRWLKRTSDEIYDNQWITLTHRSVSAPTGKQGIYGVVHFKNTAIRVVPIDADGYTWLVGRYRYTLNQYQWEIPEGGVPLEESALADAQRELREETGSLARRWASLLKLHTCNLVTDEVARIFIAQDLSQGDTQHPMQPRRASRVDAGYR